jgi:hypothetical protein
MFNLLRNLWSDECGSVTADWAFVAALLVLGAVTGSVLLRPELTADADDVTAPAPASSISAQP